MARILNPHVQKEMHANLRLKQLERWYTNFHAYLVRSFTSSDLNVLNRIVGLLSIPSLLRKLYEYDIRSVMVEGGASVIDTFMNQASQPRGPEESPVVDTLIVTVAPTIVGDDGLGYTVGAPEGKLSVSDHLVFFGMSTDSVHQVPKFVHVRTELMGKDTIIAGKFI